MNLEQINPEGIKRPIKDGKKKGLYYRIGQSSYTVYIAEGWATAAAIHEAKPCKPVVLAAMSSNNLEAVTGIACRIFTENSIVIAADNDEAGRQAAISAASRYDLKIIIPEQEGQDFWDVFSAKRTAGSKSNA